MQGTLARDILGNPAEVMTRNGVKVGCQHVVALACWYGSNGFDLNPMLMEDA